MSDSNRSSRTHRHHHQHHSYEGPRSSRADGLSEEYLTALSDDLFQPEEPDAGSRAEDEKLSQELRRSIEKHLASYSEEDEQYRIQQEEQRSRKRHSGASRKQRKRKNSDAWSRGRRRSRILIGLLIAIAAILLALILTFFVLRHMGEQRLKNSVVEKPVEITVPTEEEQPQESDGDFVVYNGERYWYNEDIITVLCIGVDREAFASPDDMVIGGNGQADADVLLIFDKARGEINFLNISRDAMVELDRYNIQGQYIDTVNEQLCLSYAFGNGQETSCENTALSVSRLLYGMPINAYVAIDFDSIAALNDAVGGVSVPITEEIADKFPNSPVGSLVTLVGSEAVTYVRTRDTSLLDSNNARMSRQKQFIIAFLRKALEQIKSDPTRTLSLFNSVSDNMVTSMKLSEVTYFGSFFAEHGFKEENMTSVQGEVIEGEDGYAQFIPDETALYETVLDLFYIKDN